jgi:hypothetical protein
VPTVSSYIRKVKANVKGFYVIGPKIQFPSVLSETLVQLHYPPESEAEADRSSHATYGADRTDDGHIKLDERNMERTMKHDLLQSMREAEARGYESLRAWDRSRGTYGRVYSENEIKVINRQNRRRVRRDRTQRRGPQGPLPGYLRYRG